MTDDVLRLHALYCELTGQVGLSLRFDRQRVWWDWTRLGWGEADLRVVVGYLRAGIAEGRRNQGALKFSNLIGQPDRFEEDLFEARRVAALPPVGSRKSEAARDAENTGLRSKSTLPRL